MIDMNLRLDGLVLLFLVFVIGFWDLVYMYVYVDKYLLNVIDTKLFFEE